jgi:hypothetical protein
MTYLHSNLSLTYCAKKGKLTTKLILEFLSKLTVRTYSEACTVPVQYVLNLFSLLFKVKGDIYNYGLKQCKYSI